MAIFEIMAAYNPHIPAYIACAQTSSNTITVPTTPEAFEFCYCDYECEYEQMVLASASETAEYYNDKSSFLFQGLVAADTVVIELWKDGVLYATITDDTYGTYSAAGTWTEVQGQEYYVGFEVDWSLVLASGGAAQYQIKASLTVLGNASSYESQLFRLYPYSEYLADGTVVLKWKQNGNIISNAFDFTGMDWEQHYRVDGFFGFKKPKFETDQYLSSGRKRKQIQDEITNEYTLEVMMLPSTMYNPLIYDGLLANEYYITDYNLFNNERYQTLPVYPSEITEMPYHAGNRRARFTATFTDKVKNIIKRNF